MESLGIGQFTPFLLILPVSYIILHTTMGQPPCWLCYCWVSVAWSFPSPPPSCSPPPLPSCLASSPLSPAQPDSVTRGVVSTQGGVASRQSLLWGVVSEDVALLHSFLRGVASSSHEGVASLSVLAAVLLWVESVVLASFSYKAIKTMNSHKGIFAEL